MLSRHAISPHALRAVAVALALGACAKTAPTPGGLGDPCLVNADCATGITCSGGHCVLPANLGGCEAGRLRCNGPDVEKCATDGLGWDLVSACAIGCVAGACLPEICTPGAHRCEGDASESCTPAGGVWAFVQECPAHCDDTTGLCKAPICTPFAASCSADGLSVLTCDSFGAALTSTACDADQQCSSGRCVPAPICTPGAHQCSADASEECAPDGSAWILVNLCSSACDPTSGLCEAPVCTPFSVTCSADHRAVVTCDSVGHSAVASACAARSVCDNGRCLATICTPGAVRCASGGAATESCNALGDGWSPGDACPYGCGGTSSGACLPAACSVGDSRCSPSSPSALESCLPDESGWAFVSFCSTGCSGGVCNPLVCTPYSRQCEPDATHVDTCSALGTEWDRTDSCPQGCQSGQCVTSSANCAVGELRCNGPDTQLCTGVVASPGVTQWSGTGTCLAGCQSGGCLPGGSCVQPLLHSGAPIRSGVPTAPADGTSSVLIYSDVILGEDGAPLPDGTLFTATATAPTLGSGQQPTITSADADSATPGVQVASTHGRVRFAVQMPLLSGASGEIDVAIQLEQGGACNAQLAMSANGTGALAGTVLLAEDFSTTRARDAINSSANWSTTQQALTSSWPDAVGDGADGDLSVAAGATNNLATSGYAPAFGVLGLSASGASLDAIAQGLSGGDEVILWSAQGSQSGAGNAGTYELLQVQSVSGASVTFANPIQNSYGAAADDDVATQRVILQRVPHLRNLTVAATGTLTTSAWDGSKGGLIFLRVSGAANILGTIDANGLGFRGGAGGAAFSAGEDATGVAGSDAPGGGAGGAAASGGSGSGGSYGSLGAGSAPGTTYGLKLLGRLYLGAGGGGTQGASGGGAGGGAIALFAESLNFASAGATSGLLRANGASVAGAGSGAGGSIWLGSPSATVGTAGTVALPVQAQGGAGGNRGGDGRIRVDVEAVVDATGFGGAGCTRAAPACSYGLSGPQQGQSQILYTSSGSLVVSQAALLVALDQAQLALSVSALPGTPAAADFGAISVGAPVTFASPHPLYGNSFRWRASLSPDPAQGASLVRGLQWQLQVK